MARHGENIYKRKDGRWEGRVKIAVSLSGKSIYKSVYAHSYIECKNKMRVFLVKPATKSISYAIPLSVADLANKWLAYIKPTVKESTLANYNYVLNRYILKDFAASSIQSINKSRLDAFVSQLLTTGGKKKQGLSTKTVNGILIIFKAVLKHGETEYGVSSPIAKIKLPKPQESREIVMTNHAWDKLNKFLQVTEDKTAAAIALSMYTGMRIGEICAIRKTDIDFTEKTISVKRTIQRIGNVDEKSEMKTRLIINIPKSENSNRKLPLPEILVERLKKLCKNQEDDSYILGIDGQKALEPRTLQYRFAKVLEQEKIPRINFHALRHTFATRCIERSVDVKTVSEILGHASVKMTLERYVHASMDFKRQQINLLSSVI